MNPLDQLKDIYIPPEVDAWPPAYGWWLIAILTSLAEKRLIHLCQSTLNSRTGPCIATYC